MAGAGKRRLKGSFGLLVLLAATAALAGLVPTAAAAKSRRVTIKVLSNRADLISGGDALVQVTPAHARVRVGKRNVTRSFAVRPGGRYLALLTGLRNGRNVVVARKGSAAARLTILNHANGGPVTGGPQIQPWTCLAGALDAQCNREVSYSYSYKPSGGGPLSPYDPANPPSDVATTTTDTGATVPFIVRLETGEIDRDEYRIATLYDPSKPWAPWSPQPGFNHKLVIFHGASCETEYKQAAAPDVMNETALAHGFVTMSHALDNAGHNCNIATQAESLIMTKERVIEQYGELRYTIGSGCSGGSLVQQQVANAYPGLYQGITPACSFTDAWSSAMQYVNYQLLRHYYENPIGWAPGVVWTPDSISAVEGHPDPANAVTFTSVIPSSGDPSRTCPGVPDAQVYDPSTNPTGVRCSLQDYMINLFGPRPPSVWTPVEKQIGRGFAGRPVGNLGLQYGLKGLLSGKLSAAQFLDLNQKVGSFDTDYNFVPDRMDADRPALDRVYRSGAVDQADNLDKVAIIDLRGPDPGAFHDVYRTYVMRARLDRDFGTHANQILWRGQVPLLGDSGYTDQSILAMDDWLGRVDKDKRRVALAKKIIHDKPPTLADRCTDGSGKDVDAAACDATVQAYSDPQIAAGMPMTDDTLRCELKPLDRGDYGDGTFTDAQWAQMAAIFPAGVCDFTKPGLGRHPTVKWQSYQDDAGRVVYGGRPLGAAPKSKRTK
ncbi:MAG: hypothetical protein QOJ07_1533 [Thermoleophilaceae bacterium]|nr:hypothetical protein [Thermoleophilaceae bacterium]